MPLIFDLRYVSCGLLARSVYCGRVAVASEQAATSSLALAARATSSKSGKRESKGGKRESNMTLKRALRERGRDDVL
jgi:hypothetical protein